ncbi:PadR family transcriptional regulator [Okeania hirsuta]|nr:PadR family transcriptional regulator [Okeania hirsuta]
MLSIQPMSGYDMKQFTKEVISNFWSESYGQIYTNLKLLVEEGLVSAKEVEEGKKPYKTVYEITAKGSQVLGEWLCAPVSTQVPRDELSLKLFVGPLIPLEVSLQHILTHREQQEKQLDELKEAINRMELEVSDELPYKAYWLSGSRLGILVRQAKLAWCDEMESLIRGELKKAKTKL